MARRPTPELRAPEALRATAQPNLSPISAPQVSGGRGLSALADSLSVVAPGIRRLLVEEQAKYEQEQDDRANDRMAGLSYEEAGELVQSGQLKQTENPWFQAAFEKQFGLAHAAKRRRDLATEYQTGFDRVNGNVDAWLAEKVSADAEAYADSPFIMAGFREGMRGFTGEMKDADATVKTEAAQVQIQDNFYTLALDAAQKATAAGQPVGVAVKALYDQHRAAFGLTDESMDKLTLQLAEQLAAEGDVAAVTDLTASFGDNPRFGDKARTLVDTAKANNADTVRGNNALTVVDLRTRAENGGLEENDLALIDRFVDVGAISTGDREGLLMQNQRAQTTAANNAAEKAFEADYMDGVAKAIQNGKAYAVGDLTYNSPSGAVKTVKADQAVEKVARATIDKLLTAGKTPQEAAAWLAKTGTAVTYPAWENAMSHGYTALAPLLTGKLDGPITLPEPARAGFATWQALAQTPNVRALHVTDSRARAIYEDAEALVELGVMEPDEALVRAASVDRSGNIGLAGALPARDFYALTVDLTDGASNGGYVERTIETTAKAMAGGLNISGKQAMEVARDRFEKTHTNINGTWVNTANQLLPTTFPETASALIERFAKATGEDADDLTLVPLQDGGQVWGVAYKDGTSGVAMNVHPEARSAGGMLTLKQVNAYGDQLAEERRVEAERARVEGITTKQRNQDRRVKPAAKPQAPSPAGRNAPKAAIDETRRTIPQAEPKFTLDPEEILSEAQAERNKRLVKDAPPTPEPTRKPARRVRPKPIE